VPIYSVTHEAKAIGPEAKAIGPEAKAIKKLAQAALCVTDRKSFW